MTRAASLKVLDKTLRFLALFGPETPEWGLTDLARRAELPKSTVY